LGKTTQITVSLAITNVLFKHKVGATREKLMLINKESRAQLKEMLFTIMMTSN